MPPRRPREHELETLSRLAFENVVPSAWVTREVGRDYGIDLEVEIFEAEQSTGITFKVQLKGSEKTDAVGPSRRIKMDTLAYWKNLDVPVLIAYYAADTRLIHARWAHTVGREPGINYDAKTTTVRFSPDEVLSTHDAGPRLQKDAEVLRELRAGRLARPLPVRLVTDSRVIPSLSDAKLSVRFRQAIRERGLGGDIMLLRPDDVDALAIQASLTLDSQAAVLRVALPSDYSSVRVELPADLYGSGDITGMLADDLLVAIALVVEKAGALDIAARLLAPTAYKASLTTFTDIAVVAAELLSYQGFARPVQRLALRQWQADEMEARDLGDVYLYGLMSQLEGLAVNEQEELFDGLSRRATFEESSPEPRRAGRAHYNLAQMLNTTGRTSAALDEMDLAITHDPGYGQRDYFFRERGGMRWEVGRYFEAADDYRRALEVGGDPGEVVPLLADTLVYAGHYAEAESIADDWTPTGHRLDGLLRLLRTAVVEVRAVTGLQSQERQPIAEEAIADAADDPVALRRLLVEMDALDPRVWLGLLDPPLSIPRLVVVALMALTSPQAWALATVRAVQPTDPADADIINALVSAGGRLSAESFTDAVEQVLAEVEDEAHADAVREAVYSLLDRESEDMPYTTLRAVFDDPIVSD